MPDADDHSDRYTDTHSDDFYINANTYNYADRYTDTESYNIFYVYADSNLGANNYADTNSSTNDERIVHSVCVY